MSCTGGQGDTGGAGVHLERIQVDEGFLDGLDLRLRPGLNVVIGARGSGKTSLIELVRFCLAVPAITREAGQRGVQQALSVLDGGQVTVTLTDGRDRIRFVRSSSDESPRSTAVRPDVTILSQGEIEAIGAQPSGRLHLIDRLRPERSQLDSRSEQLRSEIKSITIEIRDLLTEVDNMESAVRESENVEEELDQALKVQTSALESVEATEDDRERLALLQNESTQLKVRDGVFGRALSELNAVDTDLGRISDRTILTEAWPESAGEDDLLLPIRDSLAGSSKQLANIRSGVKAAARAIEFLCQADVRRAIEIDDLSRKIRRRLDQVEEGVGAITRRVGDLKERAGQLAALRQRLQEKRKQARSLATRRDALYRSLDQLRQDRFLRRLNIAQSVSGELGPSIQVEVTRSEQRSAYAKAIIGGLRGSGLHYNILSPHLAVTMSPLELVQAVEAREPSLISEATDIAIQRAGAVIEALRDSDLASIVAAQIDDSVALELLDGSVFKSSQEVSIGQRCTIVLPVLLTRHGGILIVDQPEDHLDNSFIASTVVAALRNRHPEDQLLFASHNANIPVLGDADLVIALDSDGKRGFVNHSGRLEEEDSVRAITDIMEGGADAFRRRAEFYGIKAEE